jgi:hypothetical protein
LSKKSKLLLGIINILPLLYFILVFTVLPFVERLPAIFWIFHILVVSSGVWVTFFNIFHAMGNKELGQGKRLTWSGVLPWVIIFNIFHAMGNRELGQGKRLTWIVLLIGFFFITNPIYWYLHIWKSQQRLDWRGLK